MMSRAPGILEMPPEKEMITMKPRKKICFLPGLLSIFLVFCACCLMCANAAARGTADNAGNIELLSRMSDAFATLVKKVEPAVVFVQVSKTLQGGQLGGGQGGDPFGLFNDPMFQRFFGPQFRPRQRRPRKFKQMGQGSGFIITHDGYIMTNNHVVGEADEIDVKLTDGRKFRAKVIGTDPKSDVAVIKIDAKGLPVVPLGDSEKLKVGEWVLAIGNPFGLTHTVTVGVVSAKGRSHLGINDYEDFIQTDAAINPGNSGGPLINIRGEVVGMNTAIFSRNGGSMGIGFAIPVNMAKAVKDQLLKNGKVVRGWLGVIIQDIDDELAKSFDLKKSEGVLVAEVSPDSPADRGGLRQGDVILRLNGEVVDDVGDLRNRIALTAPGTKISLDILRNGKHRTLKVKIGEQPDSKIVSKANHKLLGKLGLVVQDLTPDLAQQFGYAEGQGVLVAEVEPGSPAASVGMRAGQLIEETNRVPVHNMKEFLDALKLSNNTGRVLFRIRDGEYGRYVAIRIR